MSSEDDQLEEIEQYLYSRIYFTCKVYPAEQNLSISSIYLGLSCVSDEEGCRPERGALSHGLSVVRQERDLRVTAGL